MKKLLAILLAVLMLLSLFGCNNSGKKVTEKSDITESVANENNNTTTTIPEVEEVKSLSFDKTNIMDDVAEITFSSAFSTEKILPPKPDNFYHSFSAGNDLYVVLCATVKNLESSSKRINDLVKMSVNGNENNSKYLGLINDGGDLEDNASVDPLCSMTVYFAFLVPKGEEQNEYSICFEDANKVKYEGDFSLSDFKTNEVFIEVGEKIADNNLEFTLEKVYYSDSLYPPRASDYYHYYSAPDGKTFLILKTTIKNLKGNIVDFDSFASVKCVYDEKYNYDSFCVFEEDGGQDLNEFTNLYGLDPLDSGIVYYLFEVPNEVKNGKVKISIFVGNNYYFYEI